MTVNTSDLSDEMIGTLNYQWQRSSDGSNWKSIKNANNNNYQLDDPDVENSIRVKVSYTDQQGKPEVVYSQTVNAIQAVNDNPTGALIISGSRLEGETLVADTSGITDKDGVGDFSYQWQRSDTGSSNWGNISSAQANLYLINDDSSKYVRVIASYKDNQGFNEVVISTSSKITNVNTNASGSVTISGTPTEDQTLTINNNLSDGDGLGDFNYFWLKSYNNSTWNYIGFQEDLVLGDNEVGSRIKAIIEYIDQQGTLEKVTSSPTSVIANINDNPTGNIVINGKAVEGVQLSSDLSGINDDDGLPSLSSFNYQWQKSTDKLSWSNIILQLQNLYAYE